MHKIALSVISSFSCNILLSHKSHCIEFLQKDPLVFHFSCSQKALFATKLFQGDNWTLCHSQPFAPAKHISLFGIQERRQRKQLSRDSSYCFNQHREHSYFSCQLIFQLQVCMLTLRQWYITNCSPLKMDILVLFYHRQTPQEQTHRSATLWQRKEIRGIFVKNPSSSKTSSIYNIILQQNILSEIKS